jgi:23S rRNA pseudouridine1911/1915/1917 synthase
MALTVVYEDQDCVVIDKPPGLVVHPATSHRQDTLVNGLLARYPAMAAMIDPTSKDGRRPGIVHRLDRDTSGLIVVARHEGSRAELQRQFKAREVEKVYLALVYGRVPELEGRISAPIGRDPRNRQRMAVVPEGRDAITRYVARQYLLTPHGNREHYTLVEVHLLTGRTHQIRVHFAHVGQPVVGDRVYGRRKKQLACPRQFLHAWRLGFHRPGDGEWMCFEAPLPADLAKVLSQLQPVV